MSRELSVVVPCYEEALNIRPLCERLFAATRNAGLTVELLLVDDDSGQGTIDTEAVVNELQSEKYPIRIHIRRKHEGKGLSSAVILGFTKARYKNLLCMDADLQHEPESVPNIAAPILNGKAEFAIGSRAVEGGKVDGFPLIRKIISAGATMLALPLTSCRDPMSGFFCLSREVFERGQKAGLNPVGYKIGLELMVRCACKPIQEVPITFRDREAGESKLTMKQNILYLQHLSHLYWFKYSYGLVVFFLLIVALGFWVLLNVAKGVGLIQ